MAHGVSGGQLLNLCALAAVAVMALPIVLVDGECNVCSAVTGMACVTPLKFTVCSNGRPANQTSFTCPTGQVCSTVGNFICQPNVTATVADCQDCGVCDVTRTFACTSTRAFALCLGRNTLSVYTGSCAPDSVCSINYPYICGSNSDPTSGVAATCSALDDENKTSTSTTTTTTTMATTSAAPITPSASDPTPFCRIIKQSGRYPVGSNKATTCKQYVHCLLHGTSWLGATYQCPGETYFNSSSQLCSAELPPRCSANIQRMSLLNFELD